MVQLGSEFIVTIVEVVTKVPPIVKECMADQVE